MAEFCFQCNIDHYFGSYSDFEGMCAPGALRKVICEGCGFVLVNSAGECVDRMCRIHMIGVKPEHLKSYIKVREWKSRRKGRLGRVYRAYDRFWGTPWEPGFVHSVRYWWHTRNYERKKPPCFNSNPGPQQQAENCCRDCPYAIECLIYGNH